MKTKRKKKRNIVRDREQAVTTGRRIARMRLALGITQKELADEIGLLQNIVSEIERGQTRLHADILIRLSRVLKVSTDEILGLTPRHADTGNISRRVFRRAVQIDALSSSARTHILRTIDLILSGFEQQAE